ncbi:MAG: HalD/BesD family halogenase [Steroidobacteraceae bacterium]
MAARAPSAAESAVERTIAAALDCLDRDDARRRFTQQGQFLYVPQFLPPEVIEGLRAGVAAVEQSIHRSYLPGHKQGGSVSRHTIDAAAPLIAELYRAPGLIEWLAAVAGERLQLSPPSDPHAYALYFYTRAGDHIGWHYDTSYYAGRRFTALLGVIDESSCRLEYELHTRERDAAVVPGAVQIAPGGLVFFDGDALRHRITSAGEGERRVSLTFEYLTDPRMHPAWRIVSHLKDAVGYFGLRQVFRRRTASTRTTRTS